MIPEAEAGAQLTCQLLYRLLDRSQTCSISPYQGEKYSCENSPDGVLMSAVQGTVHVNFILDVLKTVMKFSEAESSTYIFIIEMTWYEMTRSAYKREQKHCSRTDWKYCASFYSEIYAQQIIRDKIFLILNSVN